MKSTPWVSQTCQPPTCQPPLGKANVVLSGLTSSGILPVGPLKGGRRSPYVLEPGAAHSLIGKLRRSRGETFIPLPFEMPRKAWTFLDRGLFRPQRPQLCPTFRLWLCPFRGILCGQGLCRRGRRPNPHREGRISGLPPPIKGIRLAGVPYRWNPEISGPSAQSSRLDGSCPAPAVGHKQPGRSSPCTKPSR
jgi:hypothetical protein